MLRHASRLHVVAVIAPVCGFNRAPVRLSDPSLLPFCCGVLIRPPVCCLRERVGADRGALRPADAVSICRHDRLQ